jgi:hypothetical protein
MSKEISVEIKISDTVTVKGSYKTEYEEPYPLKVCEGKIITLKEKGIVHKEKWYKDVHQDRNGNTKSTLHCPNDNLK